jgi:hypothetical protein
MDKETVKYFKNTKTSMLRIKTMLSNLSERVEESDAKSKINYAHEKVENALEMLSLAEVYTDEGNKRQLEMEF